MDWRYAEMNGLAIVIALMAVAVRIDAIGSPDQYTGTTAVLFTVAVLIALTGFCREIKGQKK